MVIFSWNRVMVNSDCTYFYHFNILLNITIFYCINYSFNLNQTIIDRVIAQGQSASSSLLSFKCYMWENLTSDFPPSGEIVLIVWACIFTARYNLLIMQLSFILWVTHTLHWEHLSAGVVLYCTPSAMLSGPSWSSIWSDVAKCYVVL